ncbi:MAG: hypothetical protein J5I99_10780 [Verrucomicrobia bacterium]|nr:hypothetical protein [Kiritimatiellia bacterium]MCO6401694.1 hypothetical protein [Verrucomicrobiota bacterium]
MRYLLAALLLALGATPLIAQPSATPPLTAEPPPMRFEVYPIGAMDMESTLESVRAFVGDEGNVTPDPVHQRLLVATTPARHAQIADLMSKLAVPARNVRIEVAFDSAGNQSQSELSVSGSGDISLGSGGLGGTIKLQPKIINQTTTTTGREVQTLLVSSGREASLRIGESVPYLQWFTEYGFHYGWNVPQLAWQEVGSFLVVQPTVIGNGPLVRIKLTPELRGLVNGAPEHLRYSAVSTEVVVSDGQSVSLGGLDQNRDFYDRFLVGMARNGGTESLNIRLTPHIQTLAPPPAR